MRHTRNALIAIFLSLACAFANADDTRTACFNERIKSLKVELDGYPLAAPIIVLNTNDRLIFSFDHLADEREYLRYELVHCNADWQPSGLVDTEFLDGFNQGDIEAYDYSQLTMTRYVHYDLAIPNEEVAPKLSGNYLLKVYPDSDPDDVWLQCRFMVSEQTAEIGAEVTSRTDVDINRKHQQLSIIVDSEHSGVPDPFNDLIVQVQQNGRYDNEATLTHPLRMASRAVSVYEHQSPLIFEAGNEYRRFETVTTHYPSMGVEEMAYHEPYYHAKLFTDQPRKDEMYLYDQTQNGRFTIREYNSNNSDIEADYVVTHFTLDAPYMESAQIYIDGDFVNRRFDPESMMTYNRATGLYERNMLLKQGAYNYQYLVVPSGENKGRTDMIEGDKYQTVNEYVIKVYARHPGDRYDRLIGTHTIYSGR